MSHTVGLYSLLSDKSTANVKSVSSLHDSRSACNQLVGILRLYTERCARRVCRTAFVLGSLERSIPLI